MPQNQALAVWDRLWAVGRDFGLRPIGYAALDLARIEAGFVVCGTDFKSTHAALRPTLGTTPFALDAARLVSFDTGPFTARRATPQPATTSPRSTICRLTIPRPKHPHHPPTQ